MKFIGGPMHAQEVPDVVLLDMPEFLHIERINADCSVTVMVYIRQEWFVAPGKPTIGFYGMLDEDIDKLIDIGRKVMTPC